MMNATPLRAQVHADTLSLSDVITSTSATSSPLDELRYRGKATQVDFDFSSFCRHRSRDGGSADLKSSQSWRDEDPGSPVHLLGWRSGARARSQGAGPAGAHGDV